MLYYIIIAQENISLYFCIYKALKMSNFTWWQSVIIGSSGGLTIWFVNFLREQYLIERDKRKIYNFLVSDLREKGSVWKFRNTWAIASNVNLPEDRVRYISSLHKKIKRSEEEGEVWKLAE
jgi:hypothetical protein